MRISNTVPYMAAAHDETLSTCGDYNLPGGFSLIHQQAWELNGLLNSYYMCIVGEAVLFMIITS